MTTTNENESELAPFGEWQTTEELEKRFWRLSDKLSPFVARHGGRNTKKLRDEFMPIIALAKELGSQPRAWDQRLEIRCNPRNLKTSAKNELDGEIRWHCFQKEISSELPRQSIEVTRCQLNVLAERREEEKLHEGGEPDLGVRDTITWSEVLGQAFERVNSKLTKNYPPNTILVLYVEGDEAHNAINWWKENPTELDALLNLAAKKFSHLFLWGPSAGRHFAKLKH